MSLVMLDVIIFAINPFDPYSTLIRADILMRYLTTGVADLSWDTSTSSQVWNCDGSLLKILMDHKF